MKVFLHEYIYMFLKQEKSEMDEFEEEKTLVLKEKIQCLKFFNGYTCKMSQNIFAHSLDSEHF